MVSLTMSQSSSPSKMVHITIPGSGSGFSSSRTESISAKMKKILTSPKGMRGKSEPPPFKTFGVLLEFLYERDKVEVPIIVTRLCEYLKTYGLRQEGLFRVNGNIKVVERLKSSFDKSGGADLEDIGDVPACASLLKMFLRELSDPVIPEDLQPSFISIQHKYCQDRKNLVPRVKKLAQQMPNLNISLLKYLCEFMLYITSSSEGNKMSPLALAIVFGPNIFRCGEGLNGLRDQAYVNAVLLLMLQEYEDIFKNDEANATSSRERPKEPQEYLDHVRSKEIADDKAGIPGLPQVRLHSPKHSNLKITGMYSKDNRPNSDRPSSSVKEYSDKINSDRPNSEGLVENTINIAVKEFLFGPNMVTSSCESDKPDETKPDESVENIYLSVKDRVKNFVFEMNEETLNEGLICQSRRSKSCGARKTRRNVYERCMSENKKEITDEDLNFVGGMSTETLERLTAARVPPPQNRRKPSFSKNRDSEPLDSIDNMDNKLNNSLPVKNNVNIEFVYNEENNEINLKNIDNAKLKQATNESKQKLTSYQVVDSSDSRPEVSTPVTPLHRLSGSVQPLIVNTITSADVTRVQEETAQVSPREKYHMSFNDGPRQSPRSSAPSSPQLSEKRREKWNEKKQDSLPLSEMSPQTLKKKIVSLKKTITNLETSFEETHGRKPKSSEKAHIQKYIAELGRAKKQLKELLSDKAKSDATTEQSVTSPTSSNAHTLLGDEVDNDLESKEETLSLLLKKLEDKRLEVGRPQEILSMTGNQLKDEKLAVQKALLMYENHHGRPSSKEDKTLMRSLYDRYRKIKRLIAAGKPEPSTIQPCDGEASPNYYENINNSNKHLTDEYPEEAARNIRNSRVSHLPNNTYENYPNDNPISSRHGEIDNMADTFLVTNRLHDTLDTSAILSPGYDSPRSGDDAILHDATINELLEQQRLTKKTKKRLGKLLKDFEEDFFNQYNRKVQKNDRLPKQAEYREYKLIKAKLRLVEALIEKKKSAYQASN